MANVKKISSAKVSGLLRHNAREVEHSANADIDPGRLDACYFLHPDRGMSDFDYYKQRLSELYVYGRDDVKTAASWVINAPKDLPVEQQDTFFKACYDFLSERYGGEKNVVQCAIHKDELSEGIDPQVFAHMHFVFIPVVPDLKPNHIQDEKVCAYEVLTREELRNIHGDLQHHLDELGIDAKVKTGITKRQGGNRSIESIKEDVVTNIGQARDNGIRTGWSKGGTEWTEDWKY